MSSSGRKGHVWEGRGQGVEVSVSAGKPTRDFTRPYSVLPPTVWGRLLTKGKAEGQDMLPEITLPGNWGLK